jgi:hypothetical protein
VRQAGRSVPSRLAWVASIREPEQALAWSLTEWEHVVRLARRLRLLARLAESINKAGLLDKVQDAPRRHLIAEQRVSRYRTAAMVWALERIMAALGSPTFPCLLLKGAAYLGQDLPIAAGRLPSDVDILVPRAQIETVQGRLRAEGWNEVALDEHDQRYYREWSHEVPPLRHPIHPIELDLHHNILPPVANTRVDADRLLEHAQPSKLTGWQVLQPVDQALHSAAHLFLDSEARDRVRDLVDLDGLFRHFGSEPHFWEALLDRGTELGLVEPLALAVHFCVEWLGTPIPSATRSRLRAQGPSALRRTWLLPTLSAILTPTDPDDRPPWTQGLASAIFLARYHRARMPLRFLMRHVWHKLRKRDPGVTSPNDAAP